jgi:hypothetical protein
LIEREIQVKKLMKMLKEKSEVEKVIKSRKSGCTYSSKRKNMDEKELKGESEKKSQR